LKREPWIRRASLRSLTPTARTTTGSPTYARNSGVAGSPYLTEENTYGSTVDTVAAVLPLPVPSSVVLKPFRQTPPWNSCRCWVVAESAGVLPGGVRSPTGAALRLLEPSSHS